MGKCLVQVFVGVQVIMRKLICTGWFCCTICDLHLPYKSKLERHLQSEDHILFAKSLQTIPQDDDVTVHMHMETKCTMGVYFN